MPWTTITSAVGILKGGAVRNALDVIWSGLGFDKSPAKDNAEKGIAFTTAFIALAAKMAKADGVASPIEADTFARLYRVPADDRASVERFYNLATQDVAGYETYARRIAALFAREPELLRHVLECLFFVAAADGVLHPAEDRFLKTTARIFEIDATQFAAIRHAFIFDPDSPYEILGISPAVSNANLKARYRTLVLENHPDRLIARGVPPEFRAAADRKLATINGAYDAILKLRGIRARNAQESFA